MRDIALMPKMDNYLARIGNDTSLFPNRTNRALEVGCGTGNISKG